MRKLHHLTALCVVFFMLLHAIIIAGDMVATSPQGVAFVVDYGLNDSGKEFYTIMTVEEEVFYLIIDTERNGNNVYFLNAVTVADLLPLAQVPSEAVATLPTSISVVAAGTSVPPTAPLTDPSEPLTMEDSSLPRTAILAAVSITIIIAGGSGVAIYTKIILPKRKRPNLEAEDTYSEEDPYSGISEEEYRALWEDDAAYDDTPQ